jgi:phage terminase large subunit GpA-like protein
VLARVEIYTLASLRAARQVRRLTAGVDVQKDRLECSLVAWGDGEEGWLLDHQIFPGDTALPEPWEDLGEYLRDARVTMVCVDSGYNTSMAKAFCAGKIWALPTKGIAGMGRPMIEDERLRKQRLRVRRKKGQPIEPIGVDQAKSLIYARLKLQDAWPWLPALSGRPSLRRRVLRPARRRAAGQAHSRLARVQRVEADSPTERSA